MNIMLGRQLHFWKCKVRNKEQFAQHWKSQTTWHLKNITDLRLITWVCLWLDGVVIKLIWNFLMLWQQWSNAWKSFSNGKLQQYLKQSSNKLIKLYRKGYQISDWQPSAKVWFFSKRCRFHLKNAGNVIGGTSRFPCHSISSRTLIKRFYAGGTFVGQILAPV